MRAKATCGAKGLLQLTALRSHSIAEERQSRNCSKGWRILLTGLLSLLSYSFQDQQPQGGTSQCALGPPTASFHQENTLQICP